MAEKTQTTDPKPPPRCKAILLCDDIMREEGSRRISLIRLVYEQILERVPGRTKPVRAFLHLVDGIGEYETTVEVHDLAEDRIIFRGRGGRIGFPNRLASARLFFAIPSLSILHPGRYDVVVLGNGQEIDRYQFFVSQSHQEGESK